NPSGDGLVVTEKGTDTIAAFAIGRHGLPVDRAFVESSGATPFGFEFSRDGFLIVSEAFGGEADAGTVSSYKFDDNEGTLDVISESVPTTETAACWIAITRDGEYAYTTNTGSDTVTGYAIGGMGTLSRLDDDGVTAETGAAPTDMTVLGNRTLYVLNRNDGSVDVYGIKEGGALVPVQTVGGLDGSLRPTGLVVR
ncbi:MAG: lactonase family protein, partial [Gemmataceae bacterium]